MSPADLETIARRLFGKHWKGALARALGLDNATLYRQIDREKIPGPVAAALHAWDLILKTQKLLPPSEPGEDFRKATAETKPKKITAYAKAMLDDD